MTEYEKIERENGALFLAELARFDREPDSGKVLVAGRSWYRFGAIDGDFGYLSSREGETGLEVRPARTKLGFRWSWECRLFEGVHLRIDGDAEDVATAAQAAVGFEPEFYDLDYLGTTWRWWVAGSGRWIAVVQGEQAEVCAYKPRPNEPAFGWRMPWPAAAEVLAMAGGRQAITGEASTKEEAFRACVDAPDRLMRACGALAAKCSGLQKRSADGSANSISRGGGSHVD